VAGRFRGFLERLLSARQRETATEPASDSELLHRFTLAGDQEAFELLVWRHGVMVLGVCQRLTRDEHLAEDAFQAVFLVLARKSRSIRGSNIAGWLFRVARRVALRAAQCRFQSQELSDVPIEQNVSPIDREELSKLLDDEVARLPDRLRLPLLLCYLGGRSTEDAARELGCPRGTVLSRLSSARQLLSKRLGRRGVALPAILPIVGLELSGRIASATVVAALRFVEGHSPIDPVSLLAQGVIRTMKTNKQLAIFGAVIIATSLVGGVGWVAAKSGSGIHPDQLPSNETELNPEPQKAKPDNLKAGGSKEEFVNAAQPRPLPHTIEGVIQILNLDPVIAEALKPNLKDTEVRKLQRELCLTIGIYLAKIQTLIEIGKWNPLDFDQALMMTTSFPRNLLELMEKPEHKLKCYELGVKLLKGIFEFTDTRVLVGSDPSQNREVVKASLLEAEIKLLKFKSEMERAKK
jgi:RNA polymerase sigma factor (sigma-70 family)